MRLLKKKKNHTFLIVTNLNTHTRTLIRHLLNVKEMTTFLLGNGITLSTTDLAPLSQGNEKKIIVQNIKWLNKEINNEVTTL